METQEQEQYGISAKETNNSNSSNEELVKTTQIGKSPFVLVETEGKTWIGFGQYIIAEAKDMKEAEVKLGKTNWEVLIAIVGAITNQILKQNATGNE